MEMTLRRFSEKSGILVDPTRRKEDRPKWNVNFSEADLKEEGGPMRRDSNKSTKSYSSNSSNITPLIKQEVDQEGEDDESGDKKKKKNKKRKIIRTVAVQTGIDEIVVDLVKFVKIKKTVDCGVQTEFDNSGRPVSLQDLADVEQTGNSLFELKSSDGSKSTVGMSSTVMPKSGVKQTSLAEYGTLRRCH
jgi:hypothetical protein